MQSYDELIAVPAVTPALVFEASNVNQMLGDEMCQHTGLADNAAGIAACRRSLELDERALRLDPGHMRAGRSVGYMHLHIGNAELDDDPAQTLDEFRIALRPLNTISVDERSKLPLVGLRAMPAKSGDPVARVRRLLEIEARAGS